MEYTPIEKECKCGNRVSVDRERVWCNACMKPVYYDDRHAKKHQTTTIYIALVMLSVIGFLAYVFYELIIRPVMAS